MSKPFSRRDFLKLSGLSLGSMAFTRFTPNLLTLNSVNFDDADIVRVGTQDVAVYSKPTDENETPLASLHRDQLVHIYEEVKSDDPKFVVNPIWYRVWGGYAWRAHLQPVKNLLNVPLTTIPEGTRLLAEVTVPFVSEIRRFTKTYGWSDPLGWRIYYQSTHWINELIQGPDGQPWYGIFDHIASFEYYVPAFYLRLISPDEYTAISPNVPWDQKRIDVNLTTQTLTAYEYNRSVFQTNVSSGAAPNETPTGTFSIIEKLPSEHMGQANVYAEVEDYILAGVPWTCYFTQWGHAFHGTYWHDNFGTPMSHGCVNMRTEDAKWLFRWATPVHTADAYDNKTGRGTPVNVHR
jgi:hypothetical protein